MHNRLADSLATLASILQPCIKAWSLSLWKEWMPQQRTPFGEIRKILYHGSQNSLIPMRPRKKSPIREGREGKKFDVMLKDVLYKRSFYSVLFRCNTREEGYFLIKEAHSSIYGGHSIVKCWPRRYCVKDIIGQQWRGTVIML